MERAGVSRRIPAAILDALFLGIITVIVVVLYVTVGGVRLAAQAQDALGVPVSYRSFGSEEIWNQYERRAQEIATRIETRFQAEFTDEQAQFMGDTVSRAMEGYFLPETLSLEYFLTLDENRLNEVIDTAFDSIIDAGRADISTVAVNELRADVKGVMDEFALGTIIPRVIDFVIWLVLLPVIVWIAYCFSEAIWGRTPGKLALGIVIRKDTGEPAYVSALMLRFILKYSAVFFLVVALITRSEVLVMLAGIAAAVVLIGSLAIFGSDRRAIYDYIAGTAVYRAERE